MAMETAICKKSVDLYKKAMQKGFINHSYFTLGNFFIFIDNFKSHDNFLRIFSTLKRCLDSNDHNSFNYIVAKGIDSAMIENFPELNVLMKNRMTDISDDYRRKKLKTFNLVFDDFYFLKNIREIKELLEDGIDSNAKAQIITNNQVLSNACIDTLIEKEEDIVLFILENINP